MPSRRTGHPNRRQAAIVVGVTQPGHSRAAGSGRASSRRASRAKSGPRDPGDRLQVIPRPVHPRCWNRRAPAGEPSAWGDAGPGGPGPDAWPPVQTPTPPRTERPAVLPVDNLRRRGLDRHRRLGPSWRSVAAEKGPGDERAGAVGCRCPEIGSSRSSRCSAAFILRVGLCWRGGRFSGSSLDPENRPTGPLPPASDSPVRGRHADEPVDRVIPVAEGCFLQAL